MTTTPPAGAPTGAPAGWRYDSSPAPRRPDHPVSRDLALTVVGAVLVLTLTQQDSFAWLLLVFVLCVLVSFVLQLITATKDGLVERISIASSGAFVVVLVTAVVLLAR